MLTLYFCRITYLLVNNETNCVYTVMWLNHCCQLYSIFKNCVLWFYILSVSWPYWFLRLCFITFCEAVCLCNNLIFYNILFPEVKNFKPLLLDWRPHHCAFIYTYIVLYLYICNTIYSHMYVYIILYFNSGCVFVRAHVCSRIMRVWMYVFIVCMYAMIWTHVAHVISTDYINHLCKIFWLWEYIFYCMEIYILIVTIITLHGQWC